MFALLAQPQDVPISSNILNSERCNKTAGIRFMGFQAVSAQKRDDVSNLIAVSLRMIGNKFRLDHDRRACRDDFMGAAQDLELKSLYRDGDELYFRYRIGGRKTA